MHTALKAVPWILFARDRQEVNVRCILHIRCILSIAFCLLFNFPQCQPILMKTFLVFFVVFDAT